MSRGAKVGIIALASGLLLVLRCFWTVRSGIMDHANNPTRERGAEGSNRYTNRLIHEKSPYLLLHVHNPADWYSWGEEAFEKAHREQKPIFLSVEYSTFHWCHVMERESFSDPDIAEVVNRYFVSIKVDREERPDVDQIYKAFVQATTGGGGWPMSVFLTPDLKPFFGGTHFPPEDRGGWVGFRTLLGRLARSWEKDHVAILCSAS